MKLEDLIKIKRANRLQWLKFNPKFKNSKGIQCVYILSINGEVTYVGTTICLKSRASSHPYRNTKTNIHFACISDYRRRLDIEKILINAAKTKLNLKVGRKSLDPKEKKIQIRIMVPGKYAREAQAACNIIALRYR